MIAALGWIVFGANLVLLVLNARLLRQLARLTRKARAALHESEVAALRAQAAARVRQDLERRLARADVAKWN